MVNGLRFQTLQENCKKCLVFPPSCCRHFNQGTDLQITFQTYSDDLFRLRPARSHLPALFVQLTLFCSVHFTFQNLVHEKQSYFLRAASVFIQRVFLDVWGRGLLNP
jgi:hypothetical protein